MSKTKSTTLKAWTAAINKLDRAASAEMQMSPMIPFDEETVSYYFNRHMTPKQALDHMIAECEAECRAEAACS